jgi:hypothetical protein
VIKVIKKYLQLFGLILRYGQLRPSGEDFNRSRKEGLSNLLEFVPQHKRLTTSSAPSSLIGQLAYFKNAFRKSRGHITADNVCYIRIPKSANTSISMTVLQKKYPAISTKVITKKEINFLADVNLSYEINDSSYFTVVRNPLARLVSAYRSFFENNSPDYIYGNYLFGILPQHLSFSDFVDRISRIPDSLKDPHFKPQSCFLGYYREQKIPVKVFKIEESEKLEEFLQQNGLQLQHLNKSPEKYDYRNYFDDKTLMLACELYRVDIEQFNYTRTFEPIKECIKTVQ